MTLVRVRRQIPDGRTHYQDYNLEAKSGHTVLDLLREVRFHVDPTLAFRYSCRSAICGSCGMRINGRAALACNTQAREIEDKYGFVLVEPLGNVPVIRDLVVDMGGFWQAVHDIRPFLEERPDAPEGKIRPVSKAQMDLLKLTRDCIMCGACLSDCTSREANPLYLGPAALAKAYRFVDDVRDGKKRERLQLYSEPNGIWDCDSCLYCNEVCPKGVKPLDAIMKMREMAIQAGIVEGHGPRHAIAFYETVVKTGRLNEAATALKSLGLRGLMKQVPVAITLGIRGKQPELRKKPIPGYGDVRTLIASVKREKGRKRAGP